MSVAAGSLGGPSPSTRPPARWFVAALAVRPRGDDGRGFPEAHIHHGAAVLRRRRARRPQAWRGRPGNRVARHRICRSAAAAPSSDGPFNSGSHRGSLDRVCAPVCREAHAPPAVADDGPRHRATGPAQVSPLPPARRPRFPPAGTGAAAPPSPPAAGSRAGARHSGRQPARDGGIPRVAPRDAPGSRGIEIGGAMREGAPGPRPIPRRGTDPLRAARRRAMPRRPTWRHRRCPTPPASPHTAAT